MFLGAVMSSEKTAAAAGTVGELRFDPFAMLPFCGYNMADYFAHWLKMGAPPGRKLPKIFYVNWFRKDEDGRFLWPGYGENSRVLSWVFARCAGHGAAQRDPDRRDPAGRRARASTPAAWTSPTRRWRSCCAWTSRSGRPSCPSSASTSRNSTTCRRELHAQLDALEQRLA